MFWGKKKAEELFRQAKKGGRDESAGRGHGGSDKFETASNASSQGIDCFQVKKRRKRARGSGVLGSGRGRWLRGGVAVTWQGAS